MAIEILPKAQWLGSTQAAEAAEEEEEGGEGGEEAGYEGLMPAPVVDAEGEGGGGKGGKGPLLPTGRVVGVVRRNWRLYCGTLQVGVFFVVVFFWWEGGEWKKNKVMDACVCMYGFLGEKGGEGIYL